MEDVRFLMMHHLILAIFRNQLLIILLTSGILPWDYCNWKYMLITLSTLKLQIVEFSFGFAECCNRRL